MIDRIKQNVYVCGRITVVGKGTENFNSFCILSFTGAYTEQMLA